MSSTRSSTSPLERLPSELFLSIAEYADFGARLALSATNSHIRALFLSEIFRTLKITNDEEEANDILAFVKKLKFGDNVRAISMHGTAEPNLSPEEEQEDNADASEEDKENNAQRRKLRHQEQILAPTVAKLLRGEHLPNVKTLIVHFNFDFNIEKDMNGVWESRGDLDSTMYVFTVPETDKGMIDESEAEYPWRRLMAQTWAAVSENSNITELVIRDLIPKAVSSWFSQQWKQFLAQISVADIQIWGDARWEVGTLEGYMYFLTQMDTYFFDYMKSSIKLRLVCYEHGPLGSEWTEVADTMSLRPNCLPQLKELRLEYAVLCPELVEFLEPKATTLESLTLHECFASHEHPTPLTWAAFFSALRKSNPKWKSFNVTNNAPPPLTFKERQANTYGKKDEDLNGDGDDQDEEDEDEEVQRVRARLSSDPTSRLFLYATLTDRYGAYGDRWPAEEIIIEEFNKGQDLAEFKMLEDIIQRNNGG